MAIHLEFINFVVPRQSIVEKYPGGWEQCILDHQALIGGRVWYDDYLFRDGAMSPGDIGSLVTEWQELGFNTHRVSNGSPSEWLDVCVVEGMFGGPTLPCNWIEVEEQTAYLKGHEPGEIVNRDNFDPG